jgi:hypothetical protein
MPTQSFIEFLLFIIPGFVYVNTYRRFHPVAKETQFFEIANTTVFGILIYAIVVTLDKQALNLSLESNAAYPSVKFVGVLLGLGIVFGVIMHGFYELRFWLSRKYACLKWLSPVNQAIWETVNQKDVEDWAVVYLNDGSIYMGYVQSFSYNPNIEYQDFLLSKARRVDEELKEKYLINGIGVYLNTRDINRIEFIKGDQYSSLTF